MPARRFASAALALLAIIASTAARADDVADLQFCAGWLVPSVAERLAACTRLVEAARTRGPHELAAALINRATAYGALHQEERQFADYAAAIEAAPGAGEFRATRAAAYLDRGQRELAIADLDAAIRLYRAAGLAAETSGSSLLLSAVALRAGAYRDLGQEERAIAGWDEAIRLAAARARDGRDPTARLGLAHFHLERALSLTALRRHQEAIADCEEAMRLDPQNRGAAALCAVARAALADDAAAARAQERQALRALEAALARDPDDVQALEQRCYLLALRGRAAEGVADCARALRLRPGDLQGLAARAYAYVALERLADARADLDAAVAAAIAAGSSDGMVWFLRAIVRARTGDPAGAASDLAEARRRDPHVDSNAADAHLTAPAGTGR